MSDGAWRIRRVSALDTTLAVELSRLLIDCVQRGASLGFLSPLTRDRADAFWSRVAEDVATGARALVVAEDDDGVCGTVQLVLALPENQPHRAELVKLMVAARARRRGLGAALVRAAEKLADKGEIVRVRDEGFVDRAALGKLALEARKAVAAHHEGHPFDPGLKLETLRQKLAERVGPAVAAEAIRLAARKSLEGIPLVVEADIVRLEGFVEGRGAVPGGPLDKVRFALEDAGLKGMGEFALTELIGQGPKEAKAMLAKLVRDGALVATGGQWFDKRVIDALRERVVAHIGAQDVLTIAVFKDLSGLGRKQAIPLLELFDREGTTLRKGDDRIAGPRLKRAEHR